MLSIRLNPEIDRRLSEIARRTGRTKSYYVRELIESNIEDLEDRYLAEARLERFEQGFAERFSGGDGEVRIVRDVLEAMDDGDFGIEEVA